MTAPTGAGRRVTADDWIQAGFAVLAEGGPAALRIGRLCDRLSVTKGSFYWHFTDMREYRASLARAWGDLHDEQRRRFEESTEPDPRRRLTAMVQTLTRPRHWALERAMRIWALTDESVLASVQRSDRRVRCAVRQAFIDYGFAPDEADLRSTVLFAAGVGLLQGSGSSREIPSSLGERVLDLMLRR